MKKIDSLDAQTLSNYLALLAGFLESVLPKYRQLSRADKFLTFSFADGGSLKKTTTAWGGPGIDVERGTLTILDESTAEARLLSGNGGKGSWSPRGKRH